MNETQKNFLDLVIYQIYPRSFNDSNNDGIGDLKGIIEKLDHIKELGANAIWLCPCYKSPNRDNGYDVADYRDIMDEFGTMDDMKKLIKAMNERDMKLIMDLVPNHTSDKHKWFEESKKSRDNPYSDYYYWYDKPLNSWRASFGGSAWEYVKERDQYYLHSYAKEQPDLNWTNPKVVKEMQDVVDFWIDMGVSGFRIDVIDQISKDFDGVGYPGGRNCFGPHLHEYINKLFGREKTKTIFTVGECWANTIDEIKRHIGKDRGELSTLFQFDHLECGRSDKYTPKKESLKSLKKILVHWQKLMEENELLYSLFTDNHDNSLFLSRMGDDKNLRFESATCIAAMVYLLKGVVFIYQGQEFGTSASSMSSIDEFDDIESINIYNETISDGESPQAAIEKLNFGSRDNPRRPMAWDGTKGRGFSEKEPWLKFSNRSNEINLEADKKSDRSIFEFYKNLLALRRDNEAFRRGDFNELSCDENNYFAFERKTENERFVVVTNFEEPTKLPPSLLSGETVLSNMKNETDTMQPYEIRVCKLK